MNELIMVGDRVLIAPDEGDRQTQAGLYLPATVMEREKIRSGRVVKVGPGYVIPNPEYSGEPWSTDKEAVRYLPLQAQKGDQDRKSTRLNSSHVAISYAVFCLKKKNSIQ